MSDRRQLLRIASAQSELLRRRERVACEESLAKFLYASWQYIDPSPFMPGWHLDAIAEHLEAVARGEIRRLIINIPFRTSKSSLACVAFPAWVWAQSERSELCGPQVPFLFTSYAQSLSMRDSVKCRRLIASPWYQRLWGNRFTLTSEQNTKIRFDNSAGAYRLATSVGGSNTGEGAAIIIADDPHNAVEAESEQIRQTTVDWWDQSLSNRLNDPKTGAFVVIMSRLNEDDLSGHLLASSGEWEHLMLPMKYESNRHCVTGIGWEDPRKQDGDLLCPERFGPEEVKFLEQSLGPWGAAGQLQQRPTPRGGGILKSEWWRTWSDDMHWPVFDFILASLDTAYTEKQENDYSAMTIWGIYLDDPSYLYIGPDGKESGGTNRRRIMLIDAWQERLEFNALVLKTAKTAKKSKVDKILIEAKASGLSLAQELARLHAREPWGVEMVNPKSLDKVARAHSVVPIFADGVVVAPDKDFAQMTIDQCSVFPKGKHDDLVDSSVQAIRWLREAGLAELGEELQAEFIDRQKFRPARNRKPIYVA